MVNTSKYSFSFTGASALIAETLVIAEEYHKLNNWNEVQIFLSNNNHLNKIKQGTFKREFSEIKKRLSFRLDIDLKYNFIEQMIISK